MICGICGKEFDEEGQVICQDCQCNMSMGLKEIEK